MNQVAGTPTAIPEDAGKYGGCNVADIEIDELEFLKRGGRLSSAVRDMIGRELRRRQIIEARRGRGKSIRGAGRVSLPHANVKSRVSVSVGETSSSALVEGIASRNDLDIQRREQRCDAKLFAASCKLRKRRSNGLNVPGAGDGDKCFRKSTKQKEYRMLDKKLTIGSRVHFVQDKPAQYQPSDGPKLVVHLPAIITTVWSETCVNLQVFTDGTNSEPSPNGNPPSVKLVTSVSLDASESPNPNTWHWPETETNKERQPNVQ